MTKKELRAKYTALRKEMSNEDIQAKSIAIANNLLSLSPIWRSTYYHIFLTIKNKNEVDTTPILTILHGKDKEVIISKSDFSDRSMKHFFLTASTKIRVSSHGIPEPVEGVLAKVSVIDVVFVPLLTFDIKGHRAGYGKGFYDRFLSECHPEAIKVGLSFYKAESSIDDASASDISLDYVVTPNEIYQFKK